jgi:hypothetical protein
VNDVTYSGAEHFTGASMRRLHMLPFCLFTVCCLFSVAQTADPKAKTCTIEGRVVQAGTAEPVRKAKVELVPAGQHEESEHISAISDQEGRFKFDKVPPSEWLLDIERSGFVGQQHGHGGAKQRKKISLEPGQQISDYVVSLVPAASLAGRVRDQDGEPMSGVSITALRYKYGRGGKRTLTPLHYASTNDLGEYRIFGIMPGQYFLLATPKSDQFEADVVPASTPATKTPRLRYPATFYPGTQNETEAIALAMAGGEEGHADFNLSTVRTVKVSGKLMNLGPAIDGIRAMVMIGIPSNRGASEQAQVKAGEDTFEIENVLPGSYAIIAYSPEDNSRERFRIAREKVQVNASDVNGIVLTLESMGSSEIKGRVIVPGKTENLDKIAIRVLPANWRTLTDDTEMASAVNGYAIVAKDGTFDLKTVGAGAVLTAVTANDKSFEDYYVETVRYAGRDVTETGIDLKNKAAGTLEIVMSNEGGLLEGVVSGDDKKPVAEANVVLVPEEKLRANYTLYQTTTSDQKGHFEMKGIRPGSYKVFAWEELGDDEGGFYYDDFLKQYESNAQTVKIERKGQGTVAVKAIASANKGE